MEGELKNYSRAMVKVQIGTDHGLVYLDSGAEASIASRQLYMRLRRQGYKFHARIQMYTLADGVRQARTVQTVRAVVRLQGRETPLNLLVLPGEENNKTLLGADFLHEAAIVINLPQGVWSFADQPHKNYDFIAEDQAIALLSWQPGDAEEKPDKGKSLVQGVQGATSSSANIAVASAKALPMTKEEGLEKPFRCSSLVRNMMSRDVIGREHIYDQLERIAIYSDMLFPRQPRSDNSGAVDQSDSETKPVAAIGSQPAELPSGDQRENKEARRTIKGKAERPAKVMAVNLRADEGSSLTTPKKVNQPDKKSSR
jgi:hypothetical protein